MKTLLFDDRLLNCETLQVDTDTMEMLRTMNMANLPGVKLQQVGERYGTTKLPM